MLNILKHLNKLSKLGTDGLDDLDYKRRVVLSNQVAFVFLLVSTPYFFIFKRMEQPGLSFSVIPFVGCFTFAFLLNHFRFFRSAKLVLILSSNIALLFYSLALGKQSGMHLIFFALASIPFVFYRPDEGLERSFGLVLPVGSLFLLEYFNYRPLFGVIVLAPLYTRIIYLTMIAITFTILIMSIRFYYMINYQSEQALKDAIAELKRANLITETAYKELVESKLLQAEMSNQVAYAEVVRGIAHEIKNPLHMIRGSAEIVKDNPLDTQKNENFCNVIITSVDRLIKVMEPMMKYGRPITQFQPTLFYAGELLDEIQKLSEGSCRKKQLKLEVVYTPSLQIFADRQSIAQVLINLVVNAQQYTPEKGLIRLTVENTSFNDQDNQIPQGVCISVIDSGKGISKENMSKIFDPFFSSKIEQHNMGLGLSIVFRYVTENNGKIEVESFEGVGTTFKVYLPSTIPEGAVAPAINIHEPQIIASSPHTLESKLPKIEVTGGVFFADDVF